jgi:hypothetical protein
MAIVCPRHCERDAPLTSVLFSVTPQACNPHSGGVGHQPPSTMTRARGAIAGLGQAGAGESPLKEQRKTLFATSQEAWPEAESLAMKDSLGREPWWNADRCAPPAFGGAAVPVWHGRILKLRLSAFRFRFFLSFVLSHSSLPGLTRDSIRKRRLRRACRSFAWTTGSSPVVTSQRVACHSSGAKARRENAFIYLPLEARPPWTKTRRCEASAVAHRQLRGVG